jgi:hypothetical protein
MRKVPFIIFGAEIARDNLLYCTKHYTELVRSPDSRTLYVCPVPRCPHFVTVNR